MVIILAKLYYNQPMDSSQTDPIHLAVTPEMIGPPAPPPIIRPVHHFFSWFFYLVTTAVAGIIMGVAIITLPGPIVPPVSFWTSLLVVFGCLYITVLLHELGHALAGKLVGYHLVYLVVGPIRLGREIGGWRLRFLPKRIFTFGGWAYSVIKQLDGWHWRRSMFVLGGPIASLLLAGLVIGLRIRWQFAPISPTISLLLHSMSFTAIAILPFTLIPMTLQGQRNDALALLDNLRLRNQRSARQEAIGWLIAQAYQGQRPRDIDTAVLDQALHPSDGSDEELLASIWAYYYEMDWQQLDKAAQHLNRALTILCHEPEPAYLTLCALDAAFFEARYGKRPSIAAAWLNLVDLKKASHPASATEMELVYQRSYAALLLAQGQTQKAYQEAQRGLDLIPKSVDHGGVRIEQKWLTEIANLTHEPLNPNGG